MNGGIGKFNCSAKQELFLKTIKKTELDSIAVWGQLAPEGPSGLRAGYTLHVLSHSQF